MIGLECLGARRGAGLAILLAGAALLASGTRAFAADAPPADAARFHHVRVNSTSPEQTSRYYQFVFGATPIKYRGGPDALFTEKSFLLVNEVDAAPNPALDTGLWHIGWGGVDVAREYEWWKDREWTKGRPIEFHTTPQPLPGKDNFYMYFLGPDRELIEVNTMGHRRFAHVHLLADDVNATTRWYAEHLGQKPRRLDVPRPTGDPNTLFGIWMNSFQCDNVTFIVFGRYPTGDRPPWYPADQAVETSPTDGRPLDHVAFSYRKIEPEFERMKASGVEIVKEIATDPTFGFRSFFVRGPDKVLIEIVEEKPIPEGIWD